MKYFYFALSLLLHGAIVAAIVSYFRKSEERQEEMIFVEIVEESQLPANKSEEQKQEQEKEEEETHEIDNTFALSVMNRLSKLNIC